MLTLLIPCNSESVHSGGLGSGGFPKKADPHISKVSPSKT